MTPSLFDTEPEALAVAENGVSHDGLGRYHVFVYKLGERFGVLWHTEDRYIFSFVPFGAVVHWHGTKELDESKVPEWREGDPWPWRIIWERREGNFNQNDHDLFVDVMGKEKGEAFWSMITEAKK